MHDRFSQNIAKVVAIRLPSYGVFQTNLLPVYNYGIAQSVAFPGVLMDIDLLATSICAQDGNSAYSVGFVRAAGARMSALESAIPEQLLNDPGNSDPTLHANGASAIKALSMAASQGQKIYSLTQTNASLLNEITVDESTRADIENSLNAGMVVTIHQSPVVVSGASITGYEVIDPSTGSGAYKISGGSDGTIEIIQSPYFAVAGFAIAFLLPESLALLALAVGLLSLFSAALAMYDAYSNGIAMANCPSAVTCVQAIFLVYALVSFALTGIGLLAKDATTAFLFGIIGFGLSEEVPLYISSACNKLTCNV